MNYSVDTVIVGGGPAGSSCALTLQRNGVSSLIVEKRAFPRDKTCGGLLTEKTYKLARALLAPGGGELPDDFFVDVSDTIELWYGTERLAGSKVQKPLRKIKRSDFDNRLIEEYKRAGGTVLEHAECASVDMASHRLTLKDGGEISFRHLVAADGVFSPTARLLGCKAPRLGFCTEAHVPKPGRDDDGVIKIHFGMLKVGYGWVFPHGDMLCVGLGGAYEHGDRYDHLLRDYLAMNGLATDCTIRGAFIPSGELVDQRRGPDDAVLIGDAGGFIDPLTGEGLYFALATGIAAAQAVADSERSGAVFRADFIKKAAPYSKIVTQGNKAQSVFFSGVDKPAFRKKLKGRDGFVGYFSDHQLSEYGYSYARVWEIALDYKKRGK